MSDLDVLDGSGSDRNPSPVPNATAVLVLGIVSIVTCWLYGVIGVITGIIALVLHQKDKKLYLTNPAKYDQSFKTSKAGFICAVVGLSLSALWFLYVIVVVVIFAGAASTFGRF